VIARRGDPMIFTVPLVPVRRSAPRSGGDAGPSEPSRI
jgi:hypothetical protein